MKVLICIPCLLTGGTEIQTLSLVKALIAANHKVVVSCYFEHSDSMVARYQEAGAQVYLLSKYGNRPDDIKATVSHLWKGLKEIVREVRPDVAHIQYMAPGTIPVIILRLLGITKIIATAHTPADIYSSKGLKLISLLNNRFLTAFQCITERAEKSFFGSSQLYFPNLKLKKHGNHFTIYNNLPSYISLRETPRTFDATGSLTIGVVSRLEPIKGMDLVIPAFAEVKKNFANIRLLVVGDGSLRQSMEKQTQESNIQDSVTFAGRQPQDKLQSYYDKIDILLMPSRSEGFGLTAVEGMARGCVLIASDTGGLPEVIRDGIDGLLHEPESSASLTNKIQELMNGYINLHQISTNALQRAEIFSTKRYNSQIAALYTTISN